MLQTSENIKSIATEKNAEPKCFDVLVIGGGINGAGIARDSAGRGLSVLICEKNDWASATSSASTKLIHGGLRYLEHYEFNLVKSALIEREVLYNSAPHIIYPMRFVLPHDKTQRPKWMIRAGLFLYDNLGSKYRHNVFEKSHAISLKDHPLHNQFKTGFVYTDCFADDARLVLSNVIDASEKGAITLSNTECVQITPDNETNLWTVTLSHKAPQSKRSKKYTIQAKAIVNAAGQWVNNTLTDNLDGFKKKHKIRLVKGSHIVVPRLYNGKHAYILQNDDKRIVFTIPYQKNYTLIGTTDITIPSEANKEGNPEISEQEKDYLCSVVNRYFTNAITTSDIVWSYSGVRPLLDDGEDSASDVTRDYDLDLSYHKDLPILSIYGGKITTFRKLSEQVVDKLSDDIFPDKTLKPWTQNAILAGGDLSGTANFETFLSTLKLEFDWLPEKLVDRYAHAYGSRTRLLLKNCHRIEDMGENFGDNIYSQEITYLQNHEDATTIEDILWRRSKLGLHITTETKNKIENFLKKKA